MSLERHSENRKRNLCQHAHQWFKFEQASMDDVWLKIAWLCEASHTIKNLNGNTVFWIPTHICFHTTCQLFTIEAGSFRFATHVCQSAFLEIQNLQTEENVASQFMSWRSANQIKAVGVSEMLESHLFQSLCIFKAANMDPPTRSSMRGQKTLDTCRDRELGNSDTLLAWDVLAMNLLSRRLGFWMLPLTE